MTTKRRRASGRVLRPPMRSPGRPPVWRKEHLECFWSSIAQGCSSEDAGIAAGLFPAVGVSLFREGGGMSLIRFDPPSGRYLSFSEREEIAILYAQELNVRAIARRLDRAPSTISRELRRNASTRSGSMEYRAIAAQWHADKRSRRPKEAKLASNSQLRTWVEERLSGQVRSVGGRPIAGPTVAPRTGRRHGRRADRRWARAWSPEQISHRLPIEFPGDPSMRISHEAVY